MSIARNIPLLYIFSFLIKRPMMPIITLYYLFYNLSFTEIGIIASATLLVSLVLEIPSGIVTDFLGRKTALVLVAIFGFLSQLMYFLGEGFATFIVAGVLFGISFSFMSGTRGALLYESLRTMKKTHSYKRYNGRMVFYSSLFNGIVLIFIPIIYEMNKKAVFLIGMLFFLLAFIAALLMKEVEERNRGSVILHTKTALRHSVMNPKIRNAMIYLTLGEGLTFMLVYYYQPIMEISGISIIYFGVIYFFMRVAMAFGSRLTHRLEKRFSNRTIVIISLGFYSAILFGLSTFNLVTVILLVVLMRLFEGIHRIAAEDELQKNISATNRTTIGSISNMVRSLYTMAFAPIIGIVADSFGISIMLISLGLLYLLITAVIFFTGPRINDPSATTPKPI